MRYTHNYLSVPAAAGVDAGAVGAVVYERLLNGFCISSQKRTWNLLTTVKFHRTIWRTQDRLSRQAAFKKC